MTPFKKVTIHLIWKNFTDEIAKQLSDSKAKLVFTITDLHNSIKKATNLKNKQDIFVVTLNHQVL